MKMAAFIDKWSIKAIKEYTDNNDLETLKNEHFTLAFEQGAEMMKEMKKIEFAHKYQRLSEEEQQNMLLDKIQQKIDGFIEKFL